MLFMIIIWCFWLCIRVTTRPTEDDVLFRRRQFCHGLLIKRRPWQNSSGFCLNQRAVFESWKKIVEFFVQKKIFWDHNLEGICVMVLECLWDAELIEIFGPLALFYFLKLFLERCLRQKSQSFMEVMYWYKWPGKKALSLFRFYLKNINSSMFWVSVFN